MNRKLLALSFSIAASAASAFAEAHFFLQAAPFASYSTVEPQSELTLSPEAYARYGAMPALAAAGWSLEGGGFGLVFRLDFRGEFASFLTSAYNTNIPFVQGGIAAVGDFNYPSVGYASYEDESWNASVGRRKLKWGPGRYDLAISDGALYLDHFWVDYRREASYGTWWYNFVTIATDRAASNGGNFYKDSPGYSAEKQGLKTFFAHKIGFENPFLRVAFAELNCVRDVVPTLVDAGPFLVYHHLYADPYSNVLMSLSAEAKLGPARAFGEFAMDDLTLSFEQQKDKPSAMGWLFGAEWSILPGEAFGSSRLFDEDYALRERTFREAGGLKLSYEHYRATTYLYNRDTETGKYSIPSRLWTGGGYVDYPAAYYLGFPYGPDCSLDMLSLSYETRRLKAALDLKYLQVGDYGIMDPYVFGSNTLDWYALAEPVARNCVVELSGAWAFSEDFQAWGRGSLSFGDDPEASLTLGCAYGLEL
jgi:hypothetical protein